MADNFLKVALQNAARVGKWALWGGQGGIWAPTDKPFIPNTYVAPVDGGQYGATYTSLEAIRQSEELAIALVRISNTIAQMDFDLLGPDDKPIDGGKKTHPGYVLLKKPNPMANWTDFIKTCIFMKAAGNRYLLIEDSAYKKANQFSPLRVWLLRSDKTRPIRSTDPYAPIQSYEHFAEDGRRYVFPFDNVVHQKDPNPFTMYTGLALTQLIDMTINMEAASLDYNWRFFLQGGDPSVILSSDKQINASRKQEIIDQFRANYAGFRNAHRMMILDDGLKKDNSAAKGPREVDYTDTQRAMSRKVGAMLGVPPIVMGHVEDANRSNSTTQMQLFSSLAIEPETKVLNEIFTAIIQRFDKDLKFAFRQTPVVDQELLPQLLNAAIGNGILTPNQAGMRYLGLPNDPSPAANRRYLLINLVPMDEASQDTRQPLPGQEAAPASDLPKPPMLDGNKKPSTLPEVKAIKEAMKLLAEGNEAEGRPPKGSALQRRVLKFVVRSRSATHRAIRQTASDWIKAFGDAAAKKLESRGKTAQALKLASNSFTKLAEASDLPNLADALVPTYSDQLTHQYDLLAGLFKITGSFTASDGSHRAAVGMLAQNVVGVNQDVKAQLDALINEGVQAGLTPWQIANGTADGTFAGIRATFAGMASERSMLIARTETGAVQDQASIQAFDDMGVQVLDVIGCEDFSKMPGQVYGCNSQGIPLEQARGVRFHPNHLGAFVPRLNDAQHVARALALFHVEQGAE